MTSSSAPTLPAWTRLPPDGQKCPHTGFDRATIYRLLRRAKGEVKTVVLAGPGKAKGRRLYSPTSLIEHLDRLAAEQLAREAGK
jgi:hypothetical protein